MNGFSRPQALSFFEERELVVRAALDPRGCFENEGVALRKSKGSTGNQNRIPEGRKTRVNDLQDIR